MIQLKETIQKTLNRLLDEVWTEKSNNLPSEDPIVKSEKLSFDRQLIKILVDYHDDNRIIIKITKQL